MDILSQLKNFGRKKCLAFVLGGGGARGAFQVGALQALLEAGIQPDLLVGTSIGAANAAFIAIKGFTPEGIAALRETWKSAASADLLPSNYLAYTMHSLFGRQRINPAHRMRDFFVANGLSPDLRFADLRPIRLIVVSADLNSGSPVLHGDQLDESVLEGVLASTALPPWVTPIKHEKRFMVDGGFLSNLPLEPAISAGATKIIALDLSRPDEIDPVAVGFGPFLEKMIAAIHVRQVKLELALARERGIPTLHIQLEWPSAVPVWDFTHTEKLMELGYTKTAKMLKENKL